MQGGCFFSVSKNCIRSYKVIQHFLSTLFLVQHSVVESQLYSTMLRQSSVFTDAGEPLHDTVKTQLPQQRTAKVTFVDASGE